MLKVALATAQQNDQRMGRKKMVLAKKLPPHSRMTEKVMRKDCSG
jgi:hypothetical protein